jgi:hypothetical protein
LRRYRQYPMAKLMKTLAFVQREVDTIIMLRGSHLYTAWSPSQPVWAPSRTLPSIPGAWIAGGRRVPDILLLYVGRSPGALGWGEGDYYWRLWWCEPSEHHSRRRDGPCQRPAIRLWWPGKLFSDAGGTGFTQARPRFLFDSGSDRACACSPPCTRVAKAHY